ncbi:MAG: TetR/AcrR family transcriptional regulator [Gemmatimonadaceae bacterium]|nr:TetR/AcrR family transcriptional regulator [Gemmatimonadaceae bacterium]
MRDRKAEILDAAARLIARQGYKQTSIDDVIKASGLCGKSHFYHHFKSKEELGKEVLNRSFERFGERGLAILREPLIDPIERLNLFIDSIVVAQAERGCVASSPFCGVAAEMADAGEGFRTRIDAVFDRWCDQIRSLLEQSDGRLRDGVDAARIARFIIATLEGAVLMTRVTREIKVMQGIAEDLKRFIAMQLRDDAFSGPRSPSTGGGQQERGSGALAGSSAT